MKVNFNNLRKQALYSYHRLARTLNNNMYDTYQDTHEENQLSFSADLIQKDMDELRMFLTFIACVYEEGNEEFMNLEDVCDEIADFNPENKE